jgi:hypothetical protein
MIRPLIRLLLAATLLASMLGGRTGAAGAVAATPDEGTYLVHELQQLSDPNWARVAGLDKGLPPQTNGHDEFIAAWLKEMRSNLRGLPIGVFRQTFTPSGFIGLPAPGKAANVIVTVSGARHPDRAVVIGAHPDGEPWSKGSTYDDASGCAIILGLARELGAYWRQHGLPALTVEFVLFDAEEQGLDGSIAYIYNFHHGAILPAPLFMIDEEQSGVGYPVRPFGQQSAGILPTVAVETPRHPEQGADSGLLARIRQATTFISPRAAPLGLANRRITAARTAAFADLHHLYPTVEYRGGSAPAFSPADERFVQITSRAPGGSDNQPFEAIGLPTVTFAGDASFYERDAPSWAFPFDQPEDTFAALACDTGGAPQPGSALAAALDLPVALSFQLVQAYAPASKGTGITVLSSPAGAGQPVHYIGIGGGALHWNFGDGARATGSAVSHTYHHAGSFVVRVSGGKKTIVRHLSVFSRQPAYLSRFRGHTPPRKPWHPAELADVPGCH